MAVVTTVGLVIEFCVLWLAMWAICMVLAVAFIVLIIDPIEQWLDHRRQARRRDAQAAAAIERITLEADQSIQRLESAYTQAQASMRRIARAPRHPT
ncbi:hypothetical protein FK531_07520 [Rhodococcus spelaei]|uniref:Uncharacterized protein n=1 Tax=Rhodococcus spelaei TaxID=2546320 RepID=A0A541BM01_9NOCA|nr:hypothetical protein [Rhodococcus spelaei]TQF73353.1 hypothetical protein FK531_07520 [Rhodococcus spelaei]